jgi:hypothetical protein
MDEEKQNKSGASEGVVFVSNIITIIIYGMIIVKVWGVLTLCSRALERYIGQ